MFDFYEINFVRIGGICVDCVWFIQQVCMFTKPRRRMPVLLETDVLVCGASSLAALSTLLQHS